MYQWHKPYCHVLPITSITISTTNNILTMHTTLLTILISIYLTITCLFWIKTQITQIEQQNQKLTETSDPEKCFSYCVRLF